MVLFSKYLFHRWISVFGKICFAERVAGEWDAADTSRFALSILPKVSLRPWFDGQGEDRKFVSTVSRIMSGHCTARSHLSRFRINEGAICICLKEVLWAYEVLSLRSTIKKSNPFQILKHYSIT
jgi:hypothetical protein